MKRTLLLSSAVIALSLGLAPAMAQQDRTDSKMKRDPAATEQHDRNTSKSSDARKDETARDTTGQSDSDKAKAAETDKSKPAAQPKQAEDRNTTKPADKAAADKSKAAEPARNAEKKAPDSNKAAESREPSRSAPANAKADNKTNDASRNAKTSDPNRNAAAADNKAAPNTRISASLDTQKKTRLTAAFEKVNVRPVTNVNFSVSVGVAVPRTVELHPVPATIVEIVPQYRGYDFFVVREEIVIVEPRTHKIVDVIEHGPSRSRAETTTVRKPTLSSQQREIIRRHASSRRTTTTTTTGAAPRTTSVTIGERLPDSVEIESFPEEVYREVPSVREYRYIERGDDVYLVDPSSRTVIEEVR